MISARTQTRRSEGGNIVAVVVVLLAGIGMQSMWWVVVGNGTLRSVLRRKARSEIDLCCTCDDQSNQSEINPPP